MEDTKRAPKRAGVEELQRVLQGIADLAALGSSLTTGISFKQLTLLVQLGEDVTSILSEPDQIIPQYLDLTDEERTQLTSFVNFQVKVPANVTVEKYLQKLLDVAIALSALFN